MATYHFKCSVCDRPISARSKYFKKYLEKYFCVDAEELGYKYVCSKCRIERGEKRETKSEINLKFYPRYNKLKRNITREAVKLIEMGFGNVLAKQNFAETVKLLLANEGITKYTFEVDNNELTAITFQVPFMGKVRMKLNIDEYDEYE